MQLQALPRVVPMIILVVVLESQPLATVMHHATALETAVVMWPPLVAYVSNNCFYELNLCCHFVSEPSVTPVENGNGGLCHVHA